MADDFDQMRDTLVRRHLGKRGINGLSVDQDTGTVNVYMDETADARDVETRLKKDCGDLKIKTIRSRTGRLA